MKKLLFCAVFCISVLLVANYARIRDGTKSEDLSKCDVKKLPSNALLPDETQVPIAVCAIKTHLDLDYMQITGLKIKEDDSQRNSIAGDCQYDFKYAIPRYMIAYSMIN